MEETLKTNPFTCLSCQVAFVEPERQRLHFQTEWHRYNLKRKVAELPPVSVEEFEQRVQAQKQKESDKTVDASAYCKFCKKLFSNLKTYENHSLSKKHLKNKELKKDQIGDCGMEIVPKKGSKADGRDSVHEHVDEEIEEVDSDEWAGDPLPTTHCLFCRKDFETLEQNLEHMTLVHSFFIPDVEYCIDVKELVQYLGEKVGCGLVCLWCGERSKQYWSVDAAQRHMRDKGHCLMKLEGETLLEYSDFYDYSSSYPDADCGSHDPQEVVEPNVLDGTAYELTLPSGATIGHRSLLRYYKQRLNPNRALVLHQRAGFRGNVQNKLLAKYRSLGWEGATQADVNRKARDLQYVQRIRSKQWMQSGIKSNKLQPHFRAQVMF